MGNVAGWFLSQENKKQLYIPPGFAHGFCTLEPDTLVYYKVTAPYAPETERGIYWNDPDLNIPWPFAASEMQLSPRDQQLPFLKELDAPFHYSEYKG